jgi:5-methylthioadenosine/S-adenosylhomocysteine deaminase
MGGRCLVRGGHVVSMDPRIGEVGGCDVLIEDGTIVALGPRIPAGDTAVVEAEGMVVLPGFVDTHRHTWATVLRGALTDATLGEYKAVTRDRVATAFRPADVYAGTLLGAWEALNAGVTTVLDYAHLNPTPEHPEAGIAALRETGIRALYAHGCALGVARPDCAAEQPAYVRDLVARHFTSTDALLTFGIAFGGPYPEADWALVDELGVPATLHACVRSTDGQSSGHTVAGLAQRDALRAGTVYAHCTNATDTELGLIADSGGHVSSSPHIEMVMGHGAPVVNRALAHGLRPSLGADTVGVGPGDMFSQLRLSFAQARAAEAPPGPDEPYKPLLTTRDVLRFATLDGAVACGLGGVVGSLTPGKRADLVLVRATDVNTIPMTDPVGTVVCAADVSNVDTVFVDGKIRKRNGVLVDADLDRLRTLVRASSEHLAIR